MALTVAQCADFVRLTLGGKPDAALSTLTIVNMAGQHICGMSKWRFMERKASFLGTTAGQTYAALPADFGGLISLTGVGVNTLYSPTSIGEINELRNSTVSTGGPPYLYAIIDSTPSGSTAGVRHLELFPTPISTVVGALSLVYRAKWTDRTSDTDYIVPSPIPDYCSTLFIRVLQAHARGLQEEEQGSLSLRLRELTASPEFIAAAKQDRAMQPDLGAMSGSLSRASAAQVRYFDTITGP